MPKIMRKYNVHKLQDKNWPLKLSAAPPMNDLPGKYHFKFTCFLSAGVSTVTQILFSIFHAKRSTGRQFGMFKLTIKCILSHFLFCFLFFAGYVAR